MKYKSNTKEVLKKAQAVQKKSVDELKEVVALELVLRLHEKAIRNLNDNILRVRTGVLKGSQHFLTASGKKEMQDANYQKPKLQFSMKAGEAYAWNDASYAASLNDGVTKSWEITVAPVTRTVSTSSADIKNGNTGKRIVKVEKRAKALFWGAYTSAGKPIFSSGHKITMPPRKPFPFMTNAIEDTRNESTEIVAKTVEFYFNSLDI